MPAATLEKLAAAKPAVAAPADKKPKGDTSAIEAFGKMFASDEPLPEKIEDTPPAPVKKPDAAAPKPAKKKAVVAAAPAAPTAMEIGTAVAAEVVKAIKPAEKAVEKVAEPEMDASDKKTLSNLAHMEQLQPDKYKGLADKYKEGISKLAAYADEWEKANPGKEFNQEDEEHKKFIEEITPNWDEDDYIEAVADQRTKKAVEEVKKENAGKFSDIERRERLIASAPEVEKVKVNAARQFFKALGDDYADIVAENGAVNAEKFKALGTTDPVIHSILITQEQGLETITAEAHKIFQNLVPFDPKNQTHATLDNFVLSKERQLLGKPKDEQLNQAGKPFLSSMDYFKLPVKDRENFWTFNKADVETLLVMATTKQAKKLIDAETKKFEAMCKAKGIAIPAKAAPAAAKPGAAAKTAPVNRYQAPVEIEEVEEAADNGKPQSPTSGHSPRIAATAKTPEAGDAIADFYRRISN
jgi:hypothetical protein